MNKEYLNTHKTFFLTLGLVAFMVIVFVGIIILSFVRSQEPTPELTPTPTPRPALNAHEEIYPEATEQPYYSDGSGGSGTLIVTAAIPEVRVMIDDGEAEGPVTSSSYPIQETPFKILNIPSGKHLLRAAKPGYVFKNVTVDIQPNTIHRIHIELQKIQTVK